MRHGRCVGFGPFDSKILRAMTETEFWTALEFRVSQALSELPDNHLRFLWCDGFFPDDLQPAHGSIVGYALISEDDGKTFERYRFRLLSPAAEIE
jgi:hypothetical protein